ncbi:MAG: hypothetical protein V4620_13040 [Bacteroidota bacterium]
MERKRSWNVTDKRFVVFLDIMGFKDFVARHTHDEVYEMMSRISLVKESIDELSARYTTSTYKDKLYTTSFSDSIILFSEDDSARSLEMIVSATSFLFSTAMGQSIPMKGAIAHGLMSVNKTQQIYVGQPLIDAYLLQEEVNYYGVVAHNSIDAYLNKRAHEMESSFREVFFEEKVPLKTGKILHNNINWFSVLSIMNDEELRKSSFKEILIEMKSITSGTPRKYIDNTEEVFNLLYNKEEPKN